MPEYVEWLVPFGPWAGALATFLAVLVALRLHVKIIPPRLKLALVSPDGEPTTVDLHTISDGIVISTRKEAARYYHVRLTNERSWVVANDAGVYLVRIDAEDASGKFVTNWSGISLPITAAHYGTHPTRVVGASEIVFDLCSIVKDKWLAIHPAITPNNFTDKYRTSPGQTIKLRLVIQARSTETTSDQFEFEVAWDGRWSDDTLEIRRHMVVADVSRRARMPSRQDPRP